MEKIQVKHLNLIAKYVEILMKYTSKLSITYFNYFNISETPTVLTKATSSITVISTTEIITTSTTKPMETMTTTTMPRVAKTATESSTGTSLGKCQFL